jgi:signal transduction histidine kinase
LADAEFVRRKLGLSSVYETNLRRPDGSVVTALVSSQSFMEDNRYLGSAAFFLDITQRKKSERDVIQAKELAEFFLDLITHDISNVNQGIRGFTEILAAAPNAADEARRTYIPKILQQVDRANSLIHNIKKISELRWTWNSTPDQTIDIEETARRAVSMALSSFPDRQVDVTFQNNTGRLQTRGDYLATELFYNLIHNAIKYTPGPRALVEVAIERPTSGNAIVRVADSGPGIPDAAKGSLFTRIEAGQGDALPSGYHSGTGLTLVRLIAERYGWRVWVENRVRGDYSKGSVFIVEMAQS